MNLDYLDFEQPIAVLEAKIEELQLVSDDNALNIAAEIATLREKSRKLTESIYSNLSSWQVVQIARHPLRPYTSDYIPRLFTEFDELHGDRQFGDDQAIIGGVARLDDRPVVVIAEEKGRGITEKIRRNFGMPKPRATARRCACWSLPNASRCRYSPSSTRPAPIRASTPRSAGSARPSPRIWR